MTEQQPKPKRPYELLLTYLIWGSGEERRQTLIRSILAILIFASVAFVYNIRAYRNMAVPDAMDCAQLARNIATGNGFTTQFIRPLSIHLYTNAHPAKLAPPTSNEDAYDPAALKAGHPDLSNPPLYPLLLAVWMKIFPSYYPIPDEGSESQPFGAWLWMRGGIFAIYPPDFFITILNQILLGLVIFLSYKLAARLFDKQVAILTALLIGGSEVLWRFSTSGLSTMLLLLIFVLLAHVLVTFEQICRENPTDYKRIIFYAAIAGALIGAGMLTRYSFGWLVLPVAVYMSALAPAPRAKVTVTLVAAFLVVGTPWIIRNWVLSGLPFGTATYHILSGTPLFPLYSLDRSLSPDITSISPPLLWPKLFQNMRTVAGTEFLNLAGSWISAFWLVALVLQYRSVAISKLRLFIIGLVPYLIVVQSLLRSHQSEDFPIINAENVLVLLTPFAAMFGAALFLVLLERVLADTPWDTLRLRRIYKGVFIGIMSLPFLTSFCPPRAHPVVYPPYFPPMIQRVSNWMEKHELMMSDIPWAVAWYGDRQAIWLTPDPADTFLFVNDYIKPVRALFLTPKTLDGRFLSEWVRAGDRTWGAFVMEALAYKRVPAFFPLRNSPEGLLPEHLFLSDWERWQK